MAYTLLWFSASGIARIALLILTKVSVALRWRRCWMGGGIGQFDSELSAGEAWLADQNGVNPSSWVPSNMDVAQSM